MEKALETALGVVILDLDNNLGGQAATILSELDPSNGVGVGVGISLAFIALRACINCQ
jgi:hypothetical protein